MNWDRIEGEWKQIKGNVREKWGKLTDDDFNQIAGKREQLEGKIQERYGYAKEQVKKEVDDWSKGLLCEHAPSAFARSKSGGRRRGRSRRRGFFFLPFLLQTVSAMHRTQRAGGGMVLALHKRMNAHVELQVLVDRRADCRRRRTWLLLLSKPEEHRPFNCRPSRSRSNKLKSAQIETKRVLVTSAVPIMEDVRCSLGTVLLIILIIALLAGSAVALEATGTAWVITGGMGVLGTILIVVLILVFLVSICSIYAMERLFRAFPV